MAKKKYKNIKVEQEELNLLLLEHLNLEKKHLLVYLLF